MLVKSTVSAEEKHASRTTLLVGDVRAEFPERLEADSVVALASVGHKQWGGVVDEALGVEQVEHLFAAPLG